MSKSDWSLSDWFHCNSCYKQYSTKGDDACIKFLFTNCGHIYCTDCVDPGNSGNRPCKLCGSLFKTIVLAKNIRPDIQQYFQDPKLLIKKSLDILKFQGSHQKRLINHKLLRFGGGNSARGNNSNVVMDREKLALREEVAYLKRMLCDKEYLIYGLDEIR